MRKTHAGQQTHFDQTDVGARHVHAENGRSGKAFEILGMERSSGAKRNPSLIGQDGVFQGTVIFQLTASQRGLFDTGEIPRFPGQD